MNIQFEKVSNVSGELTIHMEKADYEANLKKSLKTFSQKAQIPGFRPGKVPVGLVKKMYGTQAKADEVNKLLQDTLFNYIKENHVPMLGEPLGSEKQVPQDIEKQDDFTFIFDIALEPEFNIELNEEGQPLEGGLRVETASLMPAYFKNEDQKKIFEGAVVNSVVTFNPTTAYDANEVELASLLKITKEEVKDHAGNFSFEISEISRFVPAELNEEFFAKVFGDDTVKTEEDARAKVKEDIQNLQANDSDYKFLLDLRAYAENKVGELEFPNELLKKIMLANNKDKDEKFVEENFDKSIQELKWQLIKGKLVEAMAVKVEDNDVKASAMQAARYQFAQYGMHNIPDEYLENYALEMLKDKRQTQALIDRCIDQKLTASLKNVVTLNHKNISAEDFAKMFD